MPHLANLAMTDNTPNVYCTAPWNGITIRENGDIKTCCVGQITLGNISETSIQDIKTSKKLLEIQNNFKNGGVDNTNCSKCLQEEKQSLPSLRDYYNRYYKVTSLDSLSLKVIDIRWSNICNLQCMYCSPMFSSMWTSALDIKSKTRIDDSHYDQVADWIVAHSSDLRELMLVGGEPLLMKQNYKILNSIPLDTKITIITNLSYNLQELPCIESLLDRKNNLVWNVSLENTAKQFEYVRNKAAWAQVEQNLLYLHQHFPDIVSVNFVYSMFSAFDIDITIKQLLSLGVKKFNLIPIDSNQTMNVFLMPEQIKKQALEKLKQAIEIHKTAIHADDIHYYNIFGYREIQEALEQQTDLPVSKKDFYDKIAWYDQWSSSKFNDLWPHVVQLVDLHLL